MENESFGGKLNIYNPAKELALQMARLIERHNKAVYFARTGEKMDEETDFSPNKKQYNKLRGLREMANMQLLIVMNSSAKVEDDCFKKWKRKNHKDNDLFEDDDNDYSKLTIKERTLELVIRDLDNAKLTKTKDDDYIVEKQIENSILAVLTNKYYDILKGLSESFKEIHAILLKHEILSSGEEEDMSKTYAEQEEEGIRRIVEA